MYPSAVCHAVLALLSEGYPPLEGRSPTRYSPVCHANNPLRGLRVRLACIRHAASVDSEPGSNSQVKFAAPRSLLAELARDKPLTQDSLLNWLFSDLSPVLTRETEVSRADRVVKFGQFTRLGALSSASARRCPLILDGLCLHVLSSFQ